MQNQISHVWSLLLSLSWNSNFFLILSMRKTFLQVNTPCSMLKRSHVLCWFCDSGILHQKCFRFGQDRKSSHNDINEFVSCLKNVYASNGAFKEWNSLYYVNIAPWSFVYITFLVTGQMVNMKIYVCNRGKFLHLIITLLLIFFLFYIE